MSVEIYNENRALGVGGANKEARKILEARKKLPDGLQSVVSGKSLISKLSNWSQTEYGVPLSPLSIAKVMKYGEIPFEIHKVDEC
jgi:hypothetical protein